MGYANKHCIFFTKKEKMQLLKYSNEDLTSFQNQIIFLILQL